VELFVVLNNANCCHRLAVLENDHTNQSFVFVFICLLTLESSSIIYRQERAHEKHVSQLRANQRREKAWLNTSEKLALINLLKTASKSYNCSNNFCRKMIFRHT